MFILAVEWTQHTNSNKQTVCFVIKVVISAI